MLKIITAPNTVLSKKSDFYNFKTNDASPTPLLRGMEEALLSASDPKGVGLAAPQIGKPLRIFMAKPTEKSKISVFINPEILDYQTKGDSSGRAPDPTSLSSSKGQAAGLPAEALAKAGAEDEAEPRSQKVRKLEGCLSLPNIWGEVERAPSITLRYLDEKEKPQTKKFNGFMATIVQHEMDHLEGILFPKRVLEQGGHLYKSHKDEKGKDIFEEIEL